MGVEIDALLMNEQIKQLIKQKNQFYKRYIWSNKSFRHINRFKLLRDKLGFLVEKSKNNYYSKLSQKLSDKNTSSKTYWWILETILNDKKILCITPAFHDNMIVIDFREKYVFCLYFLYLFDTCFPEQCWVPKSNNELLNNLPFLTEKRLSTIQISNDNIIKKINNLNANKAHRHDMISIRMLKLYGLCSWNHF